MESGHGDRVLLHELLQAKHGPRASGGEGEGKGKGGGDRQVQEQVQSLTASSRSNSWAG